METSKNLFGFTEIDAGNKVDSTLSLRRLERNLKSTYRTKCRHRFDSVFDFLTTLSDRIQEGFGKILGGDSDKKRFLKALTRVFTLLLNTKVDSQIK